MTPRSVQPDHKRVLLADPAVASFDVADEAPDASLEAPGVGRVEPYPHVRQGLVLLRALDQEEARDATVEALRHRAYLPRPDDSDEPRLLQHLQVMADGALRKSELSRELGRRRGALAQQGDDPQAALAGKSAQLLGLVDNENVDGLVIGNRKDD